MAKGPPRPLTPGEAKNSLAVRLQKTVDRGRQIDARLGFRPYQVFLVWTKWTGPERGDGNQEVVHRCQIVPTPIVQSMDSISKSPGSAGKYPQGTVRVTEVSARYTEEQLQGRVVPDAGVDQVPEPYHFFYEIVEDGRHGASPLRKRFSLSADPHLDAANQGWQLVLGRQSGDMGRDGNPANAPVDPPVHPHDGGMQRPDDDF